jgi:regulator of sigma E protease
MLEKILIFVVFLGPLIFFHELGHFFFARFFGVRVEVFSIGFGPKLFKYVHKGTEYALSVIPLGGYVKMFGDDPFSEVQLTPEEKAVAFNHKSKWARFWIVFGGPLANLILAYVLYVGLLAGGEKVPETKIGVVPATSKLYEYGLRTGDVLVGVNDEKITSFDDLNIKSSKVDSVKVRRSEEVVVLNVGMDLEPFINEFVTIASVVKRPVFVNIKGEKFFLTTEKSPKDLGSSLEEIAEKFRGGSFYLHQYAEENAVISLKAGTEQEFSTTQNDLIPSVMALGYYPVDLTVSNVVGGSPADKAGLKKDDILVEVDGKKLKTFEDLRATLQGLPDSKEVAVKYLRGSETFSKQIVPEIQENDSKKVKVIGIQSGVEYVMPKLIVAKAENFGEALTGAFTRTWDGIVKTFSGYKKLITREVSLNNIGGPLAIGKVASDSLNISLSMFFRLMAIISINLGVINLFPVPVLDGGHIMFLLIETVNNGPLSRKKLEIAQKFGVSLLFLLIFVALFNDVSRLF